MSEDNTYNTAMKLDSLQKSLAFKQSLEYSSVEEKANELSNLRSQISSLIATSNPIIEPFVGQPDIPESVPEYISETPATTEPIILQPSDLLPAAVEIPTQNQNQSSRKRRSMEDVYAGVRELYLWLVSQSPTNAIGIGGGLGFLHGCIWAILFPRFTSFLLFLFASSLAGLAGLAYRDIDMTPRQRDSITICGGIFGILAFLMFTIWVLA